MDTLACIPLSAIVSSVHQPRLQADVELSELADCILLNGLKEPPKVLPANALAAKAKAKVTKAAKAKAGDGETYLMVCGHRRHGALQILKKREVQSLPPGNARIDDGEVWVQVLIPENRSHQEAAFTSLIENYRRKDLTPFELANSYKVLVKQCKMTRKALAERVQEHANDIGYMIAALDPKNLPLPMIASWRQGTLTLGHTKVLLRLREEPKKQQQLYEKILRERLTVGGADFWCTQLQKDADIRLDHREYVLIEKRLLKHPELKEAIESKNAKLGRSSIGEKLTFKFSSARELVEFCENVQEALRDFPL